MRGEGDNYYHSLYIVICFADETKIKIVNQKTTSILTYQKSTSYYKFFSAIFKSNVWHYKTDDKIHWQF